MATLIEQFEKYIGTREYNGIVATIQTWYYGYVSKTAWCATSMSYMANECGILDQLGGKNEGVYEMYLACKAKHGKGKFYDYDSLPDMIPKGAVCFFLRRGASHVTLAYEDKHLDKLKYIACLGGNQNDSICIKSYHMGSLQAVFVPGYKSSSTTRPTVKKGYKDSQKGGTWCVTIQKALNELINARLTLDGSCGSATEYAIKSFQNSALVKGIYDSTVDGSFGPKSWKAMDKMHAVIADGYVYDHDEDIWRKP